MKKITGIFSCAALAAMLLSGCFSSKADTNTITLEKNGKITEQIAEEFAQDYYDESELEEYLETEVESYTSENGKSSVKMSGFDVEDGIAYLTMKYADADTYAAFKNVEFYWGTILEAETAGYTFDDISFLTVGDSGAESETESSALSEESSETLAEADLETVLEDDQDHVVILREALTVVVPGTVLYVSAEGTEVTDDDTVVISEDEETGVVPEVCIVYE